MKKTLVSLSIALACGASFSATADLRINGFASVYAGQATNDKQKVYGYDDDATFSNESKFAVQISADLTEGLTATSQVIARGSDDYNAEFEWAYITYHIDDSSQVNAGKMRIPFYKYSDYLDVGYAYRWVRPPQSVYGLSFSTYEGASYLRTDTLGDWDSSLQLLYGNLSEDIIAYTYADPAEMKSIWGINWTMSRDWFSARAAYLVADVSIDELNSAPLSQLIAGLNNYGLSNEASKLQTNEDSGYFLGVGFSIDYNDILVDAEYTELEVDDSVLAPQEQFFVSVGYRIGSVTIHSTYEENQDKHKASRFDTVPLTINHPQLGTIPVTTDPTNPNAPTLRALTNAALNGVHVDTSTWSVGMRYDFHPSAAFKLDYSSLDNNVTNTRTGVVTAGVDVVF
ncbi:porin [Pseudoalteromonas xiamenensis]|uniref:Porin n=1 Tax=Pseudoalteromonas xiamenensis TaxID=882626 RepID=A0A975DKE5_9GAMM|nr:porin [Pseudoalteromonas xiamenensis]QTH73365.1 porin [Pseudoalteromonas xiamenensis]